MNHLHTQPIPTDPESSAENTIIRKNENQRIQDILMENFYASMNEKPTETLRLARVDLWRDIQMQDENMRHLNDSSKPHYKRGNRGTALTEDEINDEIMTILEQIKKLKDRVKVIEEILKERGDLA